MSKFTDLAAAILAIVDGMPSPSDGYSSEDAFRDFDSIRPTELPYAYTLNPTYASSIIPDALGQVEEDYTFHIVLVREKDESAEMRTDLEAISASIRASTLGDDLVETVAVPSMAVDDIQKMRTLGLLEVAVTRIE